MKSSKLDFFTYMFPAYRAPEVASVMKLGCDNPLQTVFTHGVGAGQEFGRVFYTVVHAQACAARQEAVIEILIVD